MALSCVVVGADGSEGSAHALAWCAKLARDTSTQVIVVHVLEPQEIPSSTLDDLDEWCVPLQAAGIEYRRVLIEDSDPRVALPDIADREGADLIVVGSRGQNTMVQLVIGSVSQYLVHHAPQSVAVIRPALTSDPVA